MTSVFPFRSRDCPTPVTFLPRGDKNTYILRSGCAVRTWTPFLISVVRDVMISSHGKSEVCVETSRCFLLSIFYIDECTKFIIEPISIWTEVIKCGHSLPLKS